VERANRSILDFRLVEKKRKLRRVEAVVGENGAIPLLIQNPKSKIDWLWDLSNLRSTAEK
jgi:hypothetical protein